MKIHSLTTVSPDVWQPLLEASDDSWLFHSQTWMEMSAQVWSFNNHYFLAEHNGNYIGAFPVQVVRRTRLGKSCHHAFSTTMGSTGPFCIRTLSPVTRERVLAQLTQALIIWAKEHGVALLSYSLPPLAKNTLQNNRGVNPLVLYGWTDTSTHTRIADLTQTEAALWSALAENARRKIKQCRSMGYTVQQVNWKDRVEVYYAIHQETYHRTGVPPHPRAYFEGIASKIAEYGQAVLWMCQDKAGNPVAFHNSARFGDGSVYWTGCSRSENLDAGVNYLLFWEALLGARQSGCAWYEIGEAFPNVSKGKLKGLTDFKAKFGGELYRYYRGEIKIFDDPVPAFLRNPDSSTRRLLNQLRNHYRHIRMPRS